jgi:UDP-N-acetylglucosamine 2-epimerase
VPEQTVSVTGNTSIDALLWAVQQAAPADPLLQALAADPRRLVLVTLHRRESWGEPLREVAQALARLTELEPDVVVVVALHRNPVVREALVPVLSDRSAVLLVEPPDYGVFVHLMSRAHVILTDSGGIQEEGPSLGKPVLVARESTERPEGVEAGTARLVGTDGGRILAELRTLLQDPEAHRQMATAVNPYGDGRAAERTVTALTEFLGLSPHKS